MSQNILSRDRGLIVVKVYYFQIWNKKLIIISWIISSHMDRMYIETPYIYSVCV